MALPWAHPPELPESEPGPPASISLAEASLQLEDQLQVRWQLEAENDEGVMEAKYVWWGAKVVGPAPPEAVSDPTVQGPAFEILYEPRDTFPEEKAVVAFTKEDHVLRALDQEGAPCLWWRKKDDPWEEPPEEDEEGSEAGSEEEEGEEGAVRRLAAAGIRPGEDGHFGVGDALGIVGMATEGEDDDPLANLDAFQQRIVADGMRALVDSFEEYTREASKDGDGKVVVSAEDIHAMFARAREKRQRRE